MTMQYAIIIFYFLSTQAFGQYIASERIDERHLTPWNPKTTLEFQGVYRFGDSEWDSDLVLFLAEISFTAN